MAADGKLPVMDAVRAAYGFVPEAIPKALPAYGLYALISGLLLQSSLGLSSGQSSGAYLLGLFLAAAVGVAASAMLYRFGLRDAYEGVFGLKFSREEVSLLGANALLIVLLVIVYFVAAIFLAMLFAILVGASGMDLTGADQDPELMAEAFVEVLQGPGGTVLGLLIGGMLVGLFWMTARLITFGAASVDHQKVMVFSTWSWTKGNGGRIMLALLLAVMPLYIGGILLNLFVQSRLGIPFMANVDPEAATDVSQTTIFIWGAISSLSLLPAIVAGHGLAVYLYEGFRPASDRVEDAFD